MAYQLYDPAGKEINHHNLQDKGAWCISGASLEEGFVQVYGGKLNLTLNPQKAKDIYAPDLLNMSNDRLADLKTQNTPFFQAKSRFGFDPQHTVVFNLKDRERYEELYPDIEIYFAVDWTAIRFEGKESISVDPMTGVWFIPFEALNALCKKSPVHQYQQRLFDTKGNARDSFVLDLQNPAFTKVV